MFGSNVLEVGVGVALLFLFVSLLCTAFQEGVEMILKSRASDLERGIRLLLHDPQGGGAAKTFFEHPLIYSLFKGQYQPESLVGDGKGGLVMPRAHRANLPSYIPAANFSAALIDLVATGRLSGIDAAAGEGGKPRPATLAEWRGAADAITGNDKVAQAVRSAFELAGGDVQAARANLETWYNGTMDRVSGWYKRRAQTSLFLVGLFIAVSLNIDAVTIIRELSVNADLRKAALTVAEKAVATPPAGAAGAAPQAPTPAQSAEPAEEPAQLQIAPPAEQAATAASEAAPSTATSDATGPVTGSDKSDSAPAATPPVLGKDYEMARDAIRDIGYPVGWSGGWPAPQKEQLKCDGARFCIGDVYVVSALAIALGWIATALAVMLGAPFWFDVLNKFMVIRSTVKSYEKSSPEGSEDRRPAQPAVAAPRARGMP
jgi:hypothetical protein